MKISATVTLILLSFSFSVSSFEDDSIPDFDVNECRSFSINSKKKCKELHHRAKQTMAKLKKAIRSKSNNASDIGADLLCMHLHLEKCQANHKNLNNSQSSFNQASNGIKLLK